MARIYDGRLGDLRELLLPPGPDSDNERYDIFQNYEIEAEDRETLIAWLKEKGIETMKPWGGKAVHQHPALGLTHFRLDRTERFYRIQQLLRQQRVVPARTFLRDLEISLATFKRDLEYMRSRLNTPIVPWRGTFWWARQRKS